MKTLTGINALRHCLDCGLRLKLFYAKSPDNNPASYGRPEVREGERYKACIGGRFLCLDIDAHEGGADGVASLYAFFARRGKPRHLLPRWLSRIDEPISDDTDFPAYTRTPGGGWHLYFAYNGRPVRGELCPAVEVKTLSLTAPGSYKNGLPYVFHGDLRQAPPLPRFIEAALPRPGTAAREVPGACRKYTGPTPWARIVEWTRSDGYGLEGRNAAAFALSLKASRHGWAFDETLAALQAEPWLGDLPDGERLSACRSAYRRPV